MKIAVVGAVCALAIGGMSVAPAGASGPVRLQGSHPRWAEPANRVGDVAPSTDLVVRVYLKTRNDAELQATANAVSDPDSPRFHQFLTAAYVRARYAPTSATVGAVAHWLAANGLRVTSVPTNNMYVEAEGSARRVASTFGVTLGNYRVRGHVVRGTDGELALPANVAPSVAGVIGVDDAESLLLPRATKPAPPEAGFRNGTPCSAYWGEKLDTTDPAYGGGFPSPLPYAPCGYTPAQLRGAYGLSSTVDAGHTGSSATVAIIDAFASPTIFADASEYAQRHDPTHPLTQSQFSQVIEPATRKLQRACDASGWYGEETLDVEAVHAIAPGAHIVYVGSRDCLDSSLDKSLNDVVANTRAHIVSNSYGDQGENLPVDEVIAFEQIVEQAAAQGIGVYFASGDDGDEAATLGTPQADFPTSPFVTSVGGTSLGIDAQNHVALETGWETGKSTLVGGAYTPAAPGDFLYGSGGGTSLLFKEPSYQKNVVPRALALANGSPAARVVPDVAMLGDPNTGMLVGQTQKFPGKEGIHYDEYRIGGTSLACPLFAGVMALADDLAGSPRGFANPVLYKKVRQAGGFRDIQHVNGADVRVDFVNSVDATKGTITSVRTFDFGGTTIHTTPGYDRTTGLGVPSGATFLSKLSWSPVTRRSQ